MRLKSDKTKKELIHIEVDGNDNTDFAQRMFFYGVLIFRKFVTPLKSLVVFTGKKKKQKDYFNFKNGKTEMNYKFNTFNMQEYCLEELKKSTNPFALTAIATLLKWQEEK